MVKIPALELDRQNWKIYHVKYLEATATYYCLDVLGGRPDDGTDDWEEGNALLCSLFMETIPASIYYRIHLKSAHQIYNYLAKRFCDNDPIQELCAKKFATRANEDKRYSSAESPTSENAATGADREDLPTKDLTQGNEDINNRIVGCKDPRMSAETPAKGTSAQCTETTAVVLKGKPHEMQNQPQSSLPLTPRPPIEGKPNACKQEVADSAVTAERMNGKAQSANPPETVADIDRTALLGIKPVERACGVDEGDKEHKCNTQLQQTNFYCKESCQRNGNTNRNIPKAHGLLLEGEWLVLVCVSSEASDWNGDANMSNAAVERVDSPSKSRVTEDTPEVESEGCERGTSKGACVDEEDGDPGCRIEPVDVLNESDMLITMLIVLEEPGGGGIPRMHLGGTRLCAGDANGHGRGMNVSTGQTDVSRGWTDTLDVLNSTGTAGMSNSEGAWTYLGIRDAKHVVNATDGIGIHMDTSNGHTDVSSVQIDALTTANATETVSIPRKQWKLPNSPIEVARGCPEEPNGCGSHAYESSVCRDAHCIGNAMETAENATRNVRMCQIGQRTRNSPSTCEIVTAKRAR